MDRRNFLKTATGVVGATVAGASVSATAGPSITDQNHNFHPVADPDLERGGKRFSVVFQGANASQGIADFLHQFLSRVTQASGNAVSFDIVSSKEFAAEPTRAEKNICRCFIDDTSRAALPEIDFFSGLPGNNTLTASQVHHWLQSGGGQTQWDDVLGDVDLKPLAIAHTGPSSGLWSRQPIASADALRGRVIHAHGLARDVITSLGGEHSGLDADENCLGDERIFAAEVGDFAVALAANLPPHARYLTTPGINRHGNVVTFTMPLGAWESLTPGERLAFEHGAAATYQETLALMQSQRALANQAITRRFGVSLTPCDPALQTTITTISDSVIAHLAASSPRAERINLSYMTFLKSLSYLS